MSVFTRHRNGASDRSSTGTTRSPSVTSVAARMREHRSTMPVTVAGARLSI